MGGLGQAYVAASGLFFVFTAVTSAVQPEAFAARLGLTLAGPGGANEVRGQYAGFFLAAAIVCGLALGRVVPPETVLVLLAAIYGGLIGGRLLAVALNGGVTGYGPTVVALHAIDAVGFAAAVALIVSQRQGNGT